jgi:hypothetical protein
MSDTSQNYETVSEGDETTERKQSIKKGLD